MDDPSHITFWPLGGLCGGLLVCSSPWLFSMVMRCAPVCTGFTGLSSEPRAQHPVVMQHANYHLSRFPLCGFLPLAGDAVPATCMQIIVYELFFWNQFPLLWILKKNKGFLFYVRGFDVVEDVIYFLVLGFKSKENWVRLLKSLSAFWFYSQNSVF